MKLTLRHLFAGFLCLMAASAFGEVKLPVVEILGHQYYVYESKKGDSMFGIARKFKWNDAILQKLNPKAISPLDKGVNIYYPVSDKNEKSDAQVVDISTVGSTPVKHLVKKGETVYSISQLYGISVDKVYALNPGSKEGIKAGEILSINEPGTTPYVGENPEFYTVRKGDTLFKVAKMYNTTVASIMKLNPGISESNFKADAVIKLPKNGTGINQTVTQVEETQIDSFKTYKVAKEDTWESIAEKTGVKKEDLLNANKNSKTLKKGDIIGIPQVSTITVDKVTTEEDPREQSSEGIADIYEDVHGIADASQDIVVNVALLLSEPSSRKDLDYSRGFLTAVDRLKHSNYRIKINVVDGTKTGENVIEAIDNIEPSMIFLTSDRNIPDYITEYARNKSVPVVNTFDVRNEEYTSNPYLIQLLTPSNVFNDEIASYLIDRYKDYELIFVGENESNDQLGSSLREVWKDRVTSLPSLNLEPTSDFEFSPEGHYLIYGNDTKKPEVQKLLTQVSELRETNPLADIALVGRPNWIVFDESLSENLHRADAMIPSRFYYDKDSQESRKFMMYYKSVFDMTPVKSFPSYAAMGYDSAMYFIPSIAKTGGDLNAFVPSEETVQSGFDFKRMSNWSGFMNPVVYLVRFTPYDTVDKIKIK